MIIFKLTFQFSSTYRSLHSNSISTATSSRPMKGSIRSVYVYCTNIVPTESPIWHYASVAPRHNFTAIVIEAVNEGLSTDTTTRMPGTPPTPLHFHFGFRAKLLPQLLPNYYHLYMYYMIYITYILSIFNIIYFIYFVYYIYYISI